MARKIVKIGETGVNVAGIHGLFTDGYGRELVKAQAKHLK